MTHQPPQFAEATAAIHAAQTIVIVTHVRPDGDAIGSALGLANALRGLGKTVTVAVDDPVPHFLQWLPAADTVVDTLPDTPFDLTISTDASDAERSGEVGQRAQANSKVVINLDHHATNTYFGDIHLVQPTAASATEVVFNWWQHAGVTLNAEIAKPLMAGLVTDTIGFRTSATTPHTLAVAQSLIEAGASLTETTLRTLDVMTADELKLWQRVLPSAQIHGEVVEAVIRQDDVRAAGMEKAGTGGIVGFLRNIDSTRIAVVFLEEDDGVKISLRSKPGYDVGSVAFKLGGGGHAQASGATLDMGIDEARARVLPMLQDAVAKGKLQIV